ncbi:MAG: hypothetical protein ACE5H3_07735 [Planctomycetota bacterium]
MQPPFAAFPAFGAFAVRQYGNLWAGGPPGGESFRLPVHYTAGHLLALFSALALFLFWRNHRRTALAVAFCLVLAVLHGFFMVLIDDGDGDLLQLGDFSSKASIVSLVLLFLSRSRPLGRQALLAYGALWVFFLGSLAVPHPFGDRTEALSDLWSVSLALLLLLAWPEPGRILFRRGVLRRGLLARLADSRMRVMEV